MLQQCQDLNMCSTSFYSISPFIFPHASRFRDTNNSRSSPSPSFYFVYLPFLTVPIKQLRLNTCATNHFTFFPLIHFNNFCFSLFCKTVTFLTAGKKSYSQQSLLHAVFTLHTYFSLGNIEFASIQHNYRSSSLCPPAVIYYYATKYSNYILPNVPHLLQC